MDYGEYTGIIEARLQADAVVLHVSFEGNASGVWFQLPMKLITRGETGSGRSIRPEAVGDLDGVSLGGSLALAGRGSVSGLSQKARAILSYLPYNSHRQDGIYTSDKRVAIVAEPVPVGSPVVLTPKPSRSS